mmetsp:Transcript_92116/g.183496  ORF Transcript_92116/g.183496 Transcript_92116/m.183496 type:complete len:108 (+) Transcript_92116:137-460(+)
MVHKPGKRRRGGAPAYRRRLDRRADAHRKDNLASLLNAAASSWLPSPKIRAAVVITSNRDYNATAIVALDARFRYSEHVTGAPLQVVEALISSLQQMQQPELQQQSS